jgi:hypothetical protein
MAMTDHPLIIESVEKGCGSNLGVVPQAELGKNSHTGGLRDGKSPAAFAA